MSTFGRYGSGGSNPGKFPTPPDDNSAGFAHLVAVVGTDSGNPDSVPTSAPATFGAPEHNKAS